MVKFSKILFQKFMATPIDAVVFKCRKIFPTGNRWNRALFTSQKLRLLPKLSLTAWIAPKIGQGQPPIFGSQCSKFHPNRFTFGGDSYGRTREGRFWPIEYLPYSPSGE